MTSINASFPRLARSLRTGFLCDEINKVLRALKVGQPIGERDQQLLKNALLHLEHAGLGSKWIEHPKVDPASVENAFAFARAVDALSGFVKTPNEFREYLDGLMNSIRNALAGERLIEKSINDLISYFSIVGRIELQSSVQYLSEEDQNDISIA